VELPLGVEKKTIVYRRVGDLEIKADVYHYSDQKVRPVMAFLHGGALISGNREDEPELPLSPRSIIAWRQKRNFPPLLRTSRTVSEG
jgi:hypothetical protein